MSEMFRLCNFSNSSSLWKCSINYLLQSRNYSQIKMVKTLKKMLDKGPKKKWYKNSVIHSSPALATKKGVSDGQRRRSEQVSKVLYGYITSIVSSGELSAKIAELAVDIVKVKVLPDFSAVNIYWLSSGADCDERLEVLLKQHEARLREILISYHILGNIPYINFVRDNSATRYMEIEKLLKTADFGPDFEPMNVTSNIRSGLPQTSDQNIDISRKFDKMSLQFVDTTQYKSVSVMDKETGNLSLLKQRLEQTSNQKTDNLDDTYVSKPDLNFRSDIYGLEHGEIMQKLLLKKHKTKYRMSASDIDHSFSSESMKEPSVPVDYGKYVRKLSSSKRSPSKYSAYTLVDHMREEGRDSWSLFADEASENYEDEDTDEEDFPDK